MNPLPTKDEIARGDYEKWDGNNEFERDCLRHLGLPEDFHPDEDQAYRIVMAALEE